MLSELSFRKNAVGDPTRAPEENPLQDAGEEDPVFPGLFFLDLKGGIMITASVSMNG